MNPKMFALLLLVPMAVFATERMTTSSKDGGGKEKHKQEAAQTTGTGTGGESPTTTEPQQNTQKSVAQLETCTPNQAHRLDTKAAVAEVRTMMEEAQETYYNDGESHLGLWEDEVSPELGKWIENHVKDPLVKANPMTINLERSFSRCPSGYRVVLVSTDGKPSNEGWMVADDGCWDRPVAKFRYDVIANTVEAKAGKTLGYMPLDDFLKLCKAAKA